MIVTDYLRSHLREDHNIILSAVIFVQKGMLLPQTITPRDIMQAFMNPTFTIIVHYVEDISTCFS